jgi:hypothetical protein
VKGTPVDGQRFDGITRALAPGLSRRGALRTLGGGLVGAALAALAGRGDASAGPSLCRETGQVCGRDGSGKECCSGSCCGGLCCDKREVCAGGVPCGDVCCPPETVGCTETKLPGGSVLVGCYCGENAILQDGRCLDCGAFEAPCGDTCCPTYNGACVDGVCQLCPAETDCRHTGSAICDAYSTAGLCCAASEWAACCCESSPGAGDGWAGCCTSGVDCPPCVDVPGMHAIGGTGLCKCTAETFPDCCYCGAEGGHAQSACTPV